MSLLELVRESSDALKCSLVLVQQIALAVPQLHKLDPELIELWK